MERQERVRGHIFLNLVSHPMELFNREKMEVQGGGYGRIGGKGKEVVVANKRRMRG